MKKVLVFILSLFAAQAMQAASAATEIKLAILAPEGSAWHQVMNAWNQELKQKTQGRVELKIYAGGVLGDEKDVIRKMRVGQIHAAGVTGLGLGVINPSVRVLELPMLVSNYSEADAVMEALKPDLEKGFQEKGFVLLGWAETGFVNIFSNKPIRSRADMNGMKMWAWEGDPLVEALYKEFKIVPIPLPVTDVMTSLQTKLIDAVYAPPLGAIALQWFAHTKYMTDLKLADSTGGIVITSRALATLSPADQAALKETAKKYAAQLVQRTRSDNEKSYGTLAGSGITKVSVTPEEYQSIQEKCRNVWTQLAGNLYSKELLDKAIAAAGKGGAAASK